MTLNLNCHEIELFLCQALLIGYILQTNNPIEMMSALVLAVMINVCKHCYYSSTLEKATLAKT